jgi:hypothetical protein
MDIPDKSFQPGLLIRGLAWIWIRLARIDEQKYRDNGWASYAEKLYFKFLKLPFYGKHRQAAQELRMARISSRNFNVFFINRERHQAQSPPRELTFKHSGSGGDIIYALPTIKALSKGRAAKLFLSPLKRKANDSHPFGLNACNLLIPLLEHQPWLPSVKIYNGEAVDYDLDLFRRIPDIQTGRNSIAHWYFWVFAVSADLSQPWLQVRPPPAPRGKIVLARSARCRNLNINYTFLRDYGEIDFVGTLSEFQEMKQTLPELRHVPCEDFLQLARVIKSARFFIGNQSFPYSVAEALKVPRILEIFPRMPDVIPTGDNIGEAFFQPNFEKLVSRFWEQTAGASLARSS